MKKNYSLFAFGLLLFAALGCRTLQKIRSRETLFEGSNMADAAAAFKAKVGGPIKAFDLEITSEKATLRAQDPTQPDNLNEYRYSMLGCTGPYPLRVDEVTPLGGRFKVLLFPLDEVDLAATPRVIAAALARANVEGGKVTKITVEMGIENRAGQGRRDVPEWHIEISGPRESASATANAKGEIVAVDLSRTARAARQDYFDPQALEDAQKQIKQAFGGQVFLGSFKVSKENILFQAATSATDDEIHQYSYDINGMNRTPWGDPRKLFGIEHTKLKNHDLYFTFDEIDLSKTSEVLDISFKTSGFAHPIIPSMDFDRTWDIFTQRPKDIRWRVWVRDEQNLSDTIGVYLIFDAKGNFLRKH
jgi:hypothetical protein